jgi:hypothetical protein
MVKLLYWFKYYSVFVNCDIKIHSIDSVIEEISFREISWNFAKFLDTREISSKFRVVRSRFRDYFLSRNFVTNLNIGIIKNKNKIEDRFVFPFQLPVFVGSSDADTDDFCPGLDPDLTSQIGYVLIWILVYIKFVQTFPKRKFWPKRSFLNII